MVSTILQTQRCQALVEGSILEEYPFFLFWKKKGGRMSKKETKKKEIYAYYILRHETYSGFLPIQAKMDDCMSERMMYKMGWVGNPLSIIRGTKNLLSLYKNLVGKPVLLEHHQQIGVVTDTRLESVTEEELLIRVEMKLDDHLSYFLKKCFRPRQNTFKQYSSPALTTIGDSNLGKVKKYPFDHSKKELLQKRLKRRKEKKSKKRFKKRKNIFPRKDSSHYQRRK